MFNANCLNVDPLSPEQQAVLATSVAKMEAETKKASEAGFFRSLGRKLGSGSFWAATTLVAGVLTGVTLGVIALVTGESEQDAKASIRRVA